VPAPLRPLSGMALPGWRGGRRASGFGLAGRGGEFGPRLGVSESGSGRAQWRWHWAGSQLPPWCPGVPRPRLWMGCGASGWAPAPVHCQCPARVARPMRLAHRDRDHDPGAPGSGVGPLALPRPQPECRLGATSSLSRISELLHTVRCTGRRAASVRATAPVNSSGLMQKPE
jgi:hypothetical protein